MSERHSGTSDTGRWNGCPCGRDHPSKAKAWKFRAPRPHGEITRFVYEAFANGKSETDGNRHTVHYAGNCQSPLEIKSNSDRGALFVVTRTRCRRCKACLQAKQFYWAKTATKWTDKVHEQGLRTWFGTLTLGPSAQRDFLHDAFAEWAMGTGKTHAAWWDEPHCDERFRLVREQVLGEVKRYWKRLRKGAKRCKDCYPRAPRKTGEWDHPAAQFKYFLVFERHKSGLPHMHFMLHEQDNPIRKKHIQCAWRHGFSGVNLVDPANNSAAFYVSKYLSKSHQSRQLASTNYAKEVWKDGRTDKPKKKRPPKVEPKPKAEGDEHSEEAK